MAFIIRQAHAADAAQILNFSRIVGTETDFLSFGAEGLPYRQEELERILQSLEHSNQALVLLALNDDEMVGMGQVSQMREPRMHHRAEVAVAVKKAWWNRGIGTNLLKILIRFASEVSNADILYLEVCHDNLRALRLYSRFGFRSIGTFPGYMKVSGELIDCQIMVMPVQHRH